MPARVGFSTGTLFKHRFSIAKAIDLCRLSGNCRAIEIACTRKGQLFDLEDILRSVSDLRSFRQRSIHLPTDMRYGNDNNTEMILSTLREVHDRVGFSHMVIHPNLVDNWEVINMFNLPIAIENMGAHGKSFKSLEEIEELLEKESRLNFVFDVNHWLSNGNDLESASNTLLHFDDHLVGVHLSGFEKNRKPLHQTEQRHFISAVSKVAVPITIESVFEKPDNTNEGNVCVSKIMQKEHSFVTKALRGVSNA